jgi:hypothetical protein
VICCRAHVCPDSYGEPGPAGNGTTAPGLTDRVRFTVGHADPGSRALLRTIPTGPIVLADVPVPAVILALRTMVAGEERYFWIPPAENAGKPMIVQLTLLEVDRLEVDRQTPPLPGPATPPKKARRTRSGLPYVILRRRARRAQRRSGRFSLAR